MKSLVLLFFLGFTAFAQEFVVLRTATLSNSAEAVTIQQPSSGGKRVNFRSAWIDSTVDVEVTIERNGTAASSTSTTPVAVNPPGTATVSAYHTSNVGPGTVISRFTCKAGPVCTVDISAVSQVGSGTSKNFTLRTSSITGTVHIGIQWVETIP
jgi:hypothetical protein